MTPENNAQRLETIREAGTLIALSIFPATGYNPRKIGDAFADAIIQTLKEDAPIELDLGHECLALIISATVDRLNEHFAVIESKNRFSEMTFPLPSYEGEEDETETL